MLETQMTSNRKFSRLDTLALRQQIQKKLGNVRADKYFDLLMKFLSCKISKSDFDKLCIHAIGRENLGLHNRLLLSIIKNANLSRTPPPKPKGHRVDGPFNVKYSNGYKKSHSIIFEDSAPNIHGQQSAVELLSLGSRPPCSVEEGEEVNQVDGSPSFHGKTPVKAPLGIPVISKLPRKLAQNLVGFAHCIENCYSRGELPDSGSLRMRLVQKLETEGIDISVHDANLLNYSLDVYLKRLIKPCLDLTKSRHGNKHLERVNALPGLSGTRPICCGQKPSGSHSVSMLDFRVAMELKPSILGAEWPTLLEKVCSRTSEE